MAHLDLDHTSGQVKRLNNALVDLRRCLEQTEAAVHYVNEKWKELPPELRGRIDKLVTLEMAFDGLAGEAKVTHG